MRAVFTRLLCLLALLVASPTMGYEPAAPLAKMELEDGDCVVFLGDSITHQCLYTQYVEDFFYTRFPNKKIQFHNAGVGGARAWDALQRFDRDVASYKPKYITVLLGMNDGGYRPYDEQVFTTYHKDMNELIGRIADSGAKPVLMTPTMYDSRAARLRAGPKDEGRLEKYNAVLAYFGAWLREKAVESGYGFVDMYSPLNNLTLQQRKADADFTLIRDAVHPDAPGQLVMACAIIEDMGLRGPLSNISIQKNPKGQFVARASGGKVSDLEVDEKHVSFTWQAEGLPWVVPTEAQEGAKLLHLGHRASREGLEIHGLASGKYRLTINGETVGEYLSAALERHIELEENDKTPQYQQAMRVALLNKERNDSAVRPLRNEWGQFQQFARMKEQFKDTMADNPEQAKKVEEVQAKIDGLEDRVKMHEEKMREIEGRIFEANQPKPLKFELTRIEE